MANLTVKYYEGQIRGLKARLADLEKENTELEDRLDRISVVIYGEDGEGVEDSKQGEDPTSYDLKKALNDVGVLAAWCQELNSKVDRIMAKLGNC